MRVQCRVWPGPALPQADVGARLPGCVGAVRLTIGASGRIGCVWQNFLTKRPNCLPAPRTAAPAGAR